VPGTAGIKRLWVPLWMAPRAERTVRSGANGHLAEPARLPEPASRVGNQHRQHHPVAVLKFNPQRIRLAHTDIGYKRDRPRRARRPNRRLVKLVEHVQRSRPLLTA
jgi:hypothetical protein